MIRESFAMRIRPGMERAFSRLYEAVPEDVLAAWRHMGLANQSVWRVEDYALGYQERDEAQAGLTDADRAALRRWEAALGGVAEYIARPGQMRLMYHNIGVVRADKSLIRHRVFATRLKPGCAGEYKRRHDELIRARGDRVEDGPESNFTIWNSGDLIFGYCELVRAYDHEMTAEEREASAEWETRQLEIMDWLTDDVDWLTGQRHPKAERVFYRV